MYLLWIELLHYSHVPVLKYSKGFDSLYYKVWLKIQLFVLNTLMGHNQMTHIFNIVSFVILTRPSLVL